MANKKESDKLSFEEALAELETLVRGLETGESDLQSSIAA